ncbi:glycoside hydrolase family protein [Saccharicrinis aurantiacus]|uniref:hypothetical protein n=1 Tax=Saccharicrinis aurantiacus TaxID=1849719 RepID=UPI00094FCB93|nr:hypothetical protein [Saccharicrinis aurantiacus]
MNEEYINTCKQWLLMLSLIVSINGVAQSTNEADYFKAPSEFTLNKNLKKDYKASGKFSQNISEIFQAAINEVSSLGGGQIFIPKGEYTFAEIQMKSNVHILVDKNASIRPPIDVNKTKKGYRSFVLFHLTSNTTDPIKNVSIQGKGGMFTIDMQQVNNHLNRVFNLKNVQNFKLSNIKVLDNYSKYSAFVFNSLQIDSYLYGPVNGVVSDVSIYNSDYGYGLVQMQLGENILFKNLYGLGGCTLRLETHNSTMHDPSKFKPLNNIVARNVVSEKGNSALMVSPHFVDNGKIDVRDITAIGSGWAVRVAAGFTSKKKEEERHLTPGTFSSESVIANIKATYSPTTAQNKKKHYRYIPCDMRSLCATAPIREGGDSFNGPSIGVVLNTAQYKINIRPSEIKNAEGFLPSQHYVQAKDAVVKCPN